MMLKKFASLLIVGLLASSSGHSTALKVCNDTKFSWRVRVDGRSWQVINPQGTCKCYQSKKCPYNPGDIHNVGWVDIAKKVKDKWYKVEFQYFGFYKRWRSAFVIQMWGGYYTNVAQIIKDDQEQLQILRMWWEPPRRCRECKPCRDKPPLDGCRKNSCLIPHDNDPEYWREISDGQ